MTSPNMLTEDFLQFIWENRLFLTENLITIDGDPVEVINLGQLNSNAGPDFFNAKIKIGTTIWVGNVEIHKRASDWVKHNHSADKAYENVILHAVGVADMPVFRNNGNPIATIELRWPEWLMRNYCKLLSADSRIRCQDDFQKIDPLYFKLGYGRLMIERLEEKTKEIEERLRSNKFDWLETFFQWIARAFGFKVNSDPFEMLAKAVPLSILLKHRDRPFQIESLLFGVSGLIDQLLIGDTYCFQIESEFNFLRKKYGLKSMEKHLWKFMRMHPRNFPTVRISQLAALVVNIPEIFANMTTDPNLDTLLTQLKVSASGYWKNHYRFNRSTTDNFNKELGVESIHMLIINAFVPFMFLYGEMQNLNHLKNRAIEFLEMLPAENNAIVRTWRDLNIEVCSAFESQVLIQLKRRYCDKDRCLRCPVGNRLIQKTDSYKKHR